MKILFDTNVVLDVLLARRPHLTASATVMGAVEAGDITGVLGATTVTTLYYLAQRAVGPRLAKQHLVTLLGLFEVAPVDADVLRDALHLGLADFEDAVLHEAARHAHATGIVTRDQEGFKRSHLPVYSPEELVAIVQGETKAPPIK